MGYIIMIVGIVALLVGAAWGTRKLAKEDKEAGEGEQDEQRGAKRAEETGCGSDAGAVGAEIEYGVGKET